MQLFFVAVAFVKSFNSTFRVKDFLLTGVERVTVTANFNSNIVHNRTGFNFVTANAFNFHFLILRMYAVFHF